MYCTGCTLRFFNTSNRKKPAKVSAMNSNAYLIARSLFRYWSTGSIKLTPKLRSLKSSHRPAVAHWRRASSRLVAKNDVCQWALKPCASMSRRLGR
ncbi:hypothetical protein D3C76_1446080 [compost metagenome]